MNKVAILSISFALTLCACHECPQPTEPTVYVTNERGDTIGIQTSKKQYGFKSYQNNTVINPKYDLFYGFINGCAVVGLGDYVDNTRPGDSYENIDFVGKVGLIDSTGKLIFPIQFEEIDLIGNNLAIYMLKSKYGYCKTDGSYLTQPIYASASEFSYGRAWVANKNKYGFIDDKGKRVTDLIFDDASSFNEHKIAIVAINKKYGIIDYNGKFIVEPEYNSIASFNGGNAFFEEKELYGLINYKGEIVQKPYYKFKERFLRNYFKVLGLNGKWGILDESGKTIYEVKYDLIAFENGDEEFTLFHGDEETEVEFKDVNGKIIFVKE